MDEFGKYPERIWTRNSHLSIYASFVEEETIILVRTGHLNI